MKANLKGANLEGANLYGVILRGANLKGAKLEGANLEDTDLKGANLEDANLKGAYLEDANLEDTDLKGANLEYAYLEDANLKGANLKDAKLEGAKNIPFIPYSCPEFGSFIGYKKARDGIVELEILADAKRCSATGRKCRCNRAKVIGIYDYNHKLLDIEETVSNYDNTFVYRVGEIVEAPDFDDNRWNECTKGIHFFINFNEAVNYRV